jgi:exopolysaccharide biosynthesis WecB/TagA/CpsF family protein
MCEQVYILGTKISITDSKKVLEIIRNYDYSGCNYICLFGLLELLQSYTDDNFQKALNKSYLNPLHSRSIEFYLKRKGIKNIEPVDAVWLFTSLLNENVSHFFYGSNEATLDKIKKRIETEFPNAKISGYKAAPFIKLDEIENNEIIKKDLEFAITKKPDIIWIGIGGWKQDLLMYHYSGCMKSGLMIGVGAVFDIFAGNIKHSPRWVKRIGIRWLYYLIQQPVYRTSKLINLFISLLRTIYKKKIMTKLKIN